jgi:hypothetical protein
LVSRYSPGTVTNAATGRTLEGATVTVGGRATVTDRQGNLSIAKTFSAKTFRRISDDGSFLHRVDNPSSSGGIRPG